MIVQSNHEFAMVLVLVRVSQWPYKNGEELLYQLETSYDHRSNEPTLSNRPL